MVGGWLNEERKPGSENVGISTLSKKRLIRTYASAKENDASGIRLFEVLESDTVSRPNFSNKNW